MRRTLAAAVALLALVVVAAADGAARAQQDDSADALRGAQPAQGAPAQVVPVKKPLHPVHKPRPGRGRDPRLVAREELARRAKEFQQQQQAPPVRRSSRRLLEGKGARKEKVLSATHRKHAWQTRQMRGNQSPEHRERERAKRKTRKGTPNRRTKGQAAGRKGKARAKVRLRARRANARCVHACVHACGLQSVQWWCTKVCTRASCLDCGCVLACGADRGLLTSSAFVFAGTPAGRP